MVIDGAQRSLVADALGACRLFDRLDPEALVVVVDGLRARRFRRGEVLFHAGDPGDALFIIASGSVKITLPAEGGTEPVILTTIRPGGFFGELALLDGGARSATAVALDPVEAFVLQRGTFERLVDEQPSIRRALLSALAAEVRRLTDQVEDLHFLDLAGRLVRHLLREIAQTDGSVPPDEARLPWPYTQGELAGMIRGSRQSVNRILRDFVSQGLLRFEGDDLVIPEPRRLAIEARQ